MNINLCVCLQKSARVSNKKKVCGRTLTIIIIIIIITMIISLITIIIIIVIIITIIINIITTIITTIAITIIITPTCSLARRTQSEWAIVRQHLKHLAPNILLGNPLILAAGQKS